MYACIYYYNGRVIIINIMVTLLNSKSLLISSRGLSYSQIYLQSGIKKINVPMNAPSIALFSSSVKEAKIIDAKKIKKAKRR
jgi:hypothetical protein